MSNKPSVPKGTRDFSPGEMLKRNYIFDTIKNVFRLYGFQPIETPAMENLSTLLGKYGDEGDKLLFKVLNSGDFLSGVSSDEILQKNSQKLTGKISEKGLRYDLTVPFARYVVQYQNEIIFPFRRYQIQPVWRADRPQKGRYREFYQCDIDIIGSDSLLNEAELIQAVNDIFRKLAIKIVIKINNRKILTGISETIGQKDRITDITVAIDKIDKIGLPKVNEELAEKGLPVESIARLQPVLQMSGNNNDKLNQIGQFIRNSEIGRKGIDEIKEVFEYISFLDIEAEFDLTLARGLNYYTGAIIEVKAKDIQIGSIAGGGRYDDLTGIFGLPGVSGVGISFGADRIYDVMDQLGRFKDEFVSDTCLLFVNFGKAEEKSVLPVIAKFREAGICAELYPDAEKIKKQLNYANRKNIPYVALAGESEIAEGSVTLKIMKSGEQLKIPIAEMVSWVQNKINQ